MSDQVKEVVAEGAAQAAKEVAKAPEVKELMARIIEGAMNGVGGAVDFVVEQSPDVIQQLVVFNMVKLWVMTAIGVSLIAAVPLIHNKIMSMYAASVDDFNKTERSPYESKPDPFPYYLSSFFALCVVGTPAITMASSFFEALKITIAPKVWLIEYAVSLTK